MKTNIKKQLFNISIIILAGSSLTSCYSGGNRYITPTPQLGLKNTKNTQINYKPTIKFISKDESLVNHINKSSTKRFYIKNDKLATLKLYIDTKLISDKLEKPSVNLIGIMKKKKIKYNYEVSYKLVDALNNTITQGNVIGISDEATETITGKASIPSKSAAEDASRQLVQALNSKLSDVLIDFKIISVDDKNVFIAANKEIKLSKEDIFIVNELSVPTTLTLDSIINQPLDSNIIIAKLKVITGTFPNQGMSITLQK